MDLIKVTEENGEQLVSARDLHELLEVKKDFSDWIKIYVNNSDYGFEDGLDYTTFKGNSTESTPRPRIEYILKLDMAKELAMLSKVEKGKEVRRYFIEVEKKYKALKVPQSYAQALLEAGRLALELEKVELENKVQKQLISEYEPKVTYYDKILQSVNSVNISQIAKDYGISGKELNDILNQEKVQYKQNGQWLLYSKYQDLGYTKSVTGESNGFAWIRSKWTQKGRLFIHALLEKRNIHALEDLQN